jgi:dienelactone hydrolase
MKWCRRNFMKRFALCLIIAIVPALSIQDARSQQRPSLSWESVWIPAKDIKLEAGIVKPEGNGPFPAVIISHGSTGKGRLAPTRTLRSEFVGSEFLRHGFVVVAPMRRGRGESGGRYDEPYECDHGAAARGLQNAIEDTDHVMAYVRNLPYVDGSRIVLAGHSRGGILSVAYASQRPGVARGVVNFVGGWTSDGCSERAGRFNEMVFRDAGAASAAARVPMLFLYAENDSYYSPESIRNFGALFENGGGTVFLRLYRAVGRDGHGLFAHPSIWKDDLGFFLQKLELPGAKK